MTVAPWVASNCTALGDNCMKTRCCSAPGYTCFKKNKAWAGCKAWCAPGPDLWDVDPQPWECRPLGPLTPGVPKPQGAMAQWVQGECTADPMSCHVTKCCKDPGMQCFE